MAVSSFSFRQVLPTGSAQLVPDTEVSYKVEAVFSAANDRD